MDVQYIFQIGHMRCGTTSIYRLFRDNGIPAIHWVESGMADEDVFPDSMGDILAIRMRENLHRRSDGVKILDGFDERYRVFTNMNYENVPDPSDSFDGFMEYRYLMEDYPDAKFILNVRPVDHWVKSMLRMHRQWGGDYLHRKYRTPDEAEVEALLRQEWESHCREVVATIPPERLLVFDVERDDPVNLCRFAGLPDSAARRWGQRNKSYGRFHENVLHLLVLCVPSGIRRRIPKPVRLRGLSILRAALFLKK